MAYVGVLSMRRGVRAGWAFLGGWLASLLIVSLLTLRGRRPGDGVRVKRGATSGSAAVSTSVSQVPGFGDWHAGRGRVHQMSTGAFEALVSGRFTRTDFCARGSR